MPLKKSRSILGALGALAVGAAHVGAKHAQPFPAMHFGCNTTGPENATQLQQLAQYQMPIFEFRQQCCGGGKWDNSEAILHTQATALYSTTGARAWVYRNAHLGSMFALQRRIMLNPDDDALFLQPSSRDPKYNISWRSLNFSNPAAARWYLNVVVAEAAAEGPSVAGVFFDEVDGDSCVPGGGAALYNDTIKTFKRACMALHKAGKSCILSVTNAFAGVVARNVTNCPVAEDVMVALMGSTPFYRYYQHWMDGFIARKDRATPYSPQRCAEMVQNAIAEGVRGIPIVVRAPGASSVFAVGLRISLAGFLVGASPGSTFGYGSCWFDRCWDWQALFDDIGDVGRPLGTASVSEDGLVFSRSWSGVRVQLDCRTANASFHKPDTS